MNVTSYHPPTYRNFDWTTDLTIADEQRLCDRPYGVPSAIPNSFIDHVSGDAAYFCPFRYAVGFLPDCDLYRSALVAGLLFLGSPLAVAGLVVSVVILAFNRIGFGWDWSHVGEEVQEPVLFTEPSVTDGYASRSVVPVRWLGRIKAPVFHGAPSNPFNSAPRGLWIQSVLYPGMNPTRGTPPRHEIGVMDRGFRTAFTAAHPPLRPLIVNDPVEHRPLTVLISWLHGYIPCIHYT